MLDPRQTFIDVTVRLGRDVTIYPGTLLQGATVVGDGSDIGPDTQLDGCVVGARLHGSPHGRHRCRDRRRARSSDRSPTSAPGPRRFRSRSPARSTLHLSPTDRRRRPRRPAQLPGEGRSPWRRSPPRNWPSIRGEPTRRSPRRWRPISARRSAIRTSSSSPTVRSVPGSARACAAADVFVMQSHYGIDGRSVNDSIMEQLTMIDAAYRASAKRITAVCPFYGYARQDRKAEGREPITARLVADMFKAAGAKRMISIDLHSGQIQGFFEGPVDHLTAAPVLENYIRSTGPRLAGDRVARLGSHQGRRADGAAPPRLRGRHRVHLQAPARKARPTWSRRRR